MDKKRKADSNDDLPAVKQGRYLCDICGDIFKKRSELDKHMRSVHGQKPEDDLNNYAEDPEIVECLGESALNGSISTQIIPVTDKTKFDPLACLAVNKTDIMERLMIALKKKKAIKYYIVMKVSFSRAKDNNIEHATPFFRGQCQISLKAEDVEDGIQQSFMKIINSFIEYQRNGSNWTLEKILEIHLHITKYMPLRGSSYISTPRYIEAKRAVINPQNKDNRCFMWAILARLYPANRNSQRISKYAEHVGKLDFTGIDFPVRLSQIPKFEVQNQISVNVFGYEDKHVFPLHITQERFEKHINLLLLSDDDKKHYVLIKNLNRLLADQNKCNNGTYFCPYCLHGFTRENLLKEHIPYCQIHAPQKIKMPQGDDKWLKFTDVAKQMRVPYAIYADFESILEKISTCSPQDNYSYTEKKAHHIASGFTYKIVSANKGEIFDSVTYRGPNAAMVFMEHMVNEQTKIKELLSEIQPMDLSINDEELFQSSTDCHICHQPLNGDSVRDHDHMTGDFRGAAHNGCNLNYTYKGKTPVILHNLKGYDSHLLMEAMGTYKHLRINCIPNNMEKYITFSLGDLQFIDSLQFLNASLGKLVTNLAADGMDKFTHVEQYVHAKFPHLPVDTTLPLLIRKGVFPYEYVDSTDRFEDRALPSKEQFYSSLDEEDITDEDYQHAIEVWNTFNIQSLGEYHDLYMDTDVHLLADVFENFRDLSLLHYQLDPCHFFTSPGLAWQACLKMTGVELELLTDLDMHLFMEKGIRGGISMITHRHAIANNEYLPNYDSKMPSKYLMYLDANNLYGWAMSQALPTHDFHWLTQKEIDSLDVTQVNDDSAVGYILEVDLQYPEELHDQHNDYPLAPERMTVTDEMLSPYAKDLLEKLKLPQSSVQKLVPNLQDKKKYILHYRNLKLYLSLGLKLERVHRVMSFQQSPWLKEYIDFNTEKRKEARTDFEKDFWKLMNNAVFGKTMENLRKHMNVELVNTETRMLKLSAKPNFNAFKIFNEDLAAIHMKKVVLTLNRPIYVGFSILDLSKTLMYDFHYNYIKVKYDDMARLLFTDTDSLCYCIETEDVYADMAEDKDQYDFSGYPKHHPLHDDTNKKVLGKMKDETDGIPPEEYIGLKSKMYSLKCELKGKKTAKGVKKSVIENILKHDMYKTCLFEKQSQRNKMTTFRTDKHQIHTVTMNKVSLSPFDDKRFILEDGISSLSYGHYRIMQQI